MISRLKLLRFGRFENRSFTFKAFTFFHGGNEAGKTTLFDALFQELCAPRANRTPGRLLRERYGAARHAELIFDGAPLAIDEDEFLNLCAIRSGDIRFELDAAGEKIRAELYSGGLNPAGLARRFTGLASRKKSFRHNQELAALYERLRELEARLKTLGEKRRAVLAREDAVGEGSVLLAALDEKIAGAEKRCGELEAAVDMERRIAERRALDTLLGLAERVLRLKEELAQSPGGGRDETAGLDRLLTDREEQEERLRESRLLAEQLRLSLRRSREELTRLSARQAASIGRAARAGELLALIEARSAAGDRAGASRSGWNRGLLLAALLVFLAGLVVGFAFPSRLYQLLISLAGVLGGLGLLLSARRRTGPASDGDEDFIHRLRDDFRDLSGGAAPAVKTLTGISRELVKQRLEADWLTRELAGRTASCDELASRLSGQEAALRAAGREADRKRRAIRAWLDARSVSDRDAYLALLHRRRSATEELEKLERRLAQETAARRADSPEQLRRDCRRRLSELDREGVPGKGRPEQEFRRLESGLRAERKRLAGLQDERAVLRARQAGERGRISGSLGDLPEQMVRCESELHQVRAAVTAREEEREAAALLAALFNDLTAAAAANFAGLEAELSDWFSELVPEARRVSLTGLDTRGLRVADAGGDSRLLSHLSRGTRDAFLLAARLTLALRADSRPGVLVLDEPFFSLDARRCERALRLLGRFQAEQGWQIVLFSKDERLFALARALFPDGQFTTL